MESDLTGCTVEGLIIGADNLVLDCDGHSIAGDYSGTGDEDRGVYANNKDNVTVKNCNIYGFHLAGIELGTVTNSYFLDNTIHDIDDYGILVSSGGSNTITGNSMRNNGDKGILLYFTTSNTINSNTMNNNTYGIDLNNADGNIFTSNTFEYNNQDGIYIYDTSTGNNFTDTRACFNNQSGGASYYDIKDQDANSFTDNTCDTALNTTCDSPCYAPSVPPAPPTGKPKEPETVFSGTFALVSPDELVTMNIDKPEIDITEVNIEVNEELLDVEIEVEQLPEKPADIPDAPGNSYAYLSFTSTIPSESIERVVVEFRVSKDWIIANNIDRSTISLQRYTEDWEDLPTTIAWESDDYVYFTASVPGFSDFAITGEEIRVCTEGEKECLGSMLRICSENAWTVSKICTYGCDPVTLACKEVVCTPEEKRCSDNNLQECSSDSTEWLTLEVCPYGCDPDTLTCKEEVIEEEVPEAPPLVIPDYVLYGVIVVVLVIVAGVTFGLVCQKPKKRVKIKIARPKPAKKARKKPKKKARTRKRR